MISEPFKLFSKDRGPVNNYRIPSIVTADDGTVIACADARLYGGSDNPNRIEKVICRSFDNGESWTDMHFAVKECGEDIAHSSAAIDPCLVFDRQKGTLLMLYSHTPAGVGILNSRRGTGFDKKGRQIVMHGKRRLSLEKDGRLWDKDLATEFRVDENFDVRVGEKKVGNIRTGEGGFTEYRTSYMYLAKSFDNGLTWTKPECISTQVKDEYMCFIGAGPGVGVQLTEGEHKLAADGVRGVHLQRRRRQHLDARRSHGRKPQTSRTVQGRAQVHCGRRAHERGADRHSAGRRTQGVCPQPFEPPRGRGRDQPRRRRHLGGLPLCRHPPARLPDRRAQRQRRRPRCQIAALNVKDGDREATLVLNAASKTKRENGVIRISYDYGETFAHSLKIKDGEFVYSCMTQMKDGSIGVLFEGSTAHETVDFLKLTLDDIKASEEKI